MYIKKYWQEILLTIFILVGFFLRFWNITKLQFFTYDQARDALFVKRIIVDHKLRLIGTQTSLPGMYLPPFYYYTIVPILYVFKLNPIAIDIYSATIGILTIPLIYYISNSLFGKPAGIFSAGIVSVSSFMVELTRRAWNPNTLPFFILLSFYFLYLYFKNRKAKDLIFSTCFYGYCLSLHFSAWTILPLFVFSIIFHFFNTKNIKITLLSFGILLLFVFPIIVFNFRHNFLLLEQAKTFFINERHLAINFSNFFESSLVSLIAIFSVLFSGKLRNGYGAPLSFEGNLKQFFNLREPISFVGSETFSISIEWWGIFLFLLVLITAVYFLLKNSKKSFEKLPLTMIFILLIWGIFVCRLLQGGFFFFYYLFLFPIPFLLFGYFISKIYKVRFLRILTFILLIFIVVFHLKNTTVFAEKWRDISDLKSAAGVIAKNIQNEPFNIVTIQKDLSRWDRNSVDYRYFVETFENKSPLEWSPEDYQNAKTLFVVDETGNTSVLDSSIMEIQKFNPKTIIGSWTINKGIIIYKLSKNET